jgi:adenosylcobinamide kinase / adenosylcobinamide-phosphate guanylyltransferase
MGLTLILGGVRSGKSRLAEELANSCPPVTYLATALPGDPEMTARIARHRQRRPPEWRTAEEPWDVATVASRHLTHGCVLLECLTLWLTNRMVGLPERAGQTDEEILRAVDALSAAGQGATGRLIVVSNEVGCGLMPANDLARRFGDLLGEANQRLAAKADRVFVCWAGLPHRLK